MIRDLLVTAVLVGGVILGALLAQGYFGAYVDPVIKLVLQ
jgi:hypothetical protein